MNKEAYEGTLKQKIIEQEQLKSDRELMHYNFRLWLLESFVRINQWDLVEDVMGRIYGYKYDNTLHRPLLNAMFDALAWFIEPLYNKIVNSSKFMQNYSKPANKLTYYTDEEVNRPGRIR